MAKKTRFFIRAGDAEKGPYTRAQLREGIANRLFSKEADYRRSDDETWHPMSDLIAELAQAETEKSAAAREARLASAPDVQAPPGSDGSTRRAVLVVGGLVAMVAVALVLRASHRADLGKPCASSNDCSGDTTCFHEVGDDRSIKPEGFCTASCNSASDCSNSVGAAMSCKDAIETDPQGAKWDGSTRKTARVCTKY